MDLGTYGTRRRGVLAIVLPRTLPRPRHLRQLKIVALQLGVTLKSLYDLSWGCSRDLVADETLSLGGTLGHSDRVLLNHLKEPKITK